MPARNRFRDSVAAEVSADQQNGHAKERRLRPAWRPSPIAREAYAEVQEARAVEREAYAVEREARRYAGRFQRFGDRLFVEIADSVDMSSSDLLGDAVGDFASLVSEIFERLERIEDMLATLDFEDVTDVEGEEEQAPSDDADQDGAADQGATGNGPTNDGPRSRPRRGAGGQGQA